MTPAPIALVSGSDDNFALLLSTMLYSVVSNLVAGDQITIYILDDGISEPNKARITRVLATRRVTVGLVWLRPDLELLRDLPVSAWHRRSAYMRLLIPELLPPDLDRVIYLDSDVIVETNLRMLWESELGSLLALGVENFSDPYVAAPGALPETYQQLGLAPEATYCNTGVMLINLRRWRDERISEQVMDFTREYAHFIRFADQDGINAVIKGRWGVLDPRWNVQLLSLSHYQEYSQADASVRKEAQARLLRSPFIAHYTGKRKPSSAVYSGPRRREFLRYARASHWFGRGPRAGVWAISRSAGQRAIVAFRQLQRLLVPRLEHR